MRRTIREFGMIKPRERIAIALSGGKDSTVLMHQLVRLRERLPMDLLAILVDEGISGYRKPTIEVARRECKKLGIPLHIVSFKSEFGLALDGMLKRPRTMGACSFCGVFRRLCLQKAASRLRADKIALNRRPVMPGCLPPTRSIR